MIEHQIRPFRDGDRAAIVAGKNAEKPPHLHETVAEWERTDARRPAEEVQMRLCIGDPETDRAVAFLSAADRGTSAYRREGVCGLSLWVAPSRRRQGLGRALYARAEAFARERGLTRMKAYLRLYEADPPGVAFARALGFVVLDRDVPVMLDLTAFVPPSPTRPLPDGLHLRAFADVPDTDENWRRLYALDCLLDRDIPTRDTQRHEMPPFEPWRAAMEGPEWDPGAVILAEDGAGEWVGVSALGFQEDTNIGWTFITGVLPAYRGRGVALALKVRALKAAQARGCPLVTTENHEDNAAMRAINRKLGFVPDAPGVSYDKPLEA